MKNKKFLSRSQLMFFILQSQIGVGLLSLPYMVHLHAKNDGWISVIIAGIVVFVFMFIMWSLGKRFPNDTIYEYSNKIVGKYVGTVISFMYALNFFIISIFVVTITVNILKKWILTFTPPYVIIICIVGTGVYLARENLKVIGRFFTFVSLLILFLVFLELLSYKDANYRYLFPIGQAGFKNIMIGSHDSLTAMLGFESLLVIYPFVKGNAKDVLKYSTFAITIVTVLYTFFLITSFLVFSPEEIQLVSEPILYMLKALSYEVVERLDLIFLSIWVVPIITSFVTYLHIASVGMDKIFKQKNHKKVTLVLGILIMIISVFIPQEDKIIDKFNLIVSYSSYFFIAFIPFILLIVSIIRKKKEQNQLYEN